MELELNIPNGEEILPAVWRLRRRFYGSHVSTYVAIGLHHVVLIDGPDVTPALAAVLESYGRPVTIVLTHEPCLGGALELRRALGARIFMHPEEQPFWSVREAGEWNPDGFIYDGQLLPNGLRVVHTPGHKPGHCCFYRPGRGGAIFSGDAVSGDPDGRVAPINPSLHDWDSSLRIQSLRRLLEFEFHAILPFHGYPVLRNSREQVAAELRRLEGIAYREP